jgi:hypothetical protein
MSPSGNICRPTEAVRCRLKRKAVTGYGDERRHHLYSSDCFLGFTKSVIMRWGMLVAHPESKIIHLRFSMGNLKGSETWEVLDIYGMIILKCSLKK